MNIQPLLKYAQKYGSPESLLKAGGFPIDLMDSVAFGFKESDIKTLKPEQLHVKWVDDLENVKYQIQKSGLSPLEWAKKMNFSQPLEVSYEKGRFVIEDGHHRYYAAKILGIPLKANVSIKDKPLATITGNPDYDYDDFHRDLWNQAHKIKKYSQLKTEAEWYTRLDLNLPSVPEADNEIRDKI